jgi:hypothetical protein
MRKPRKLIVRGFINAITLSCVALFILIYSDQPRAEIQSEEKPLISHHQENKIYAKEMDGLVQNYAQNSEKIKSLEEAIKSQDEKIKVISGRLTDLQNKSSSGFEVWTGILLACVSVIVTVLGVGVALLSLVGYREIVSKGTEKAAVSAAKQAEIEFQKFISDGRLNDVIAEGINKISLRGIPSGNDLEEDAAQELKSNENS